MGRPVLAFVVAPLWLPVAATLSYMLHDFPSNPLIAILAVWPPIIVITVVAYLFTLVFGLPAFLLLRRGGRSALWMASLWGLCVAVAANIALTVLLTPFFWHGLRHKWPQLFRQLRDAPLGLIISGLLGVLIALTIAYIARAGDAGRVVDP